MTQGPSKLNAWGNSEIADLRDMPCGDLLRRVRMHLHQSIDDVARQLRIRAPLLDAIERGAIDELPGRVYAIGFVRTYADYLGLDGDKVVDLFKLQYGQDSFSADAMPNPVAMREPRILTAWVLVVFVLAAVAVMMGYAAWQQYLMPDLDTLQGRLSAHLSASPDLSESVNDQIDALLFANLSETASESARDNAALRDDIRIVASVDSWVEIRQASGRVLFSRTLKQGEELTIPPQTGLMLTTGNAGGITLSVRGETWPTLGGIGDVRRHVPLVPHDAAVPSDADKRGAGAP